MNTLHRHIEIKGYRKLTHASDNVAGYYFLGLMILMFVISLNL